MKILLTGAAGQLGQELYPRLQNLGELVAVDLQPSGSQGNTWQQLDMSDEGQFEVFLNRNMPDLVVNAAAYTAVDQAEKDSELAFAINANAPGRMARWAERHGSSVLHYSTDYVFDGTRNQPYLESDPAIPLNRYGESKLAGEAAIQASGCRHVILRSSWIYSSHGKNFVLTMLELAKRNLQLRVVGDQLGCPTWARNLAEYSMLAIGKGLVGRKKLPGSLYHCCDRDGVSWYEFASLVFQTAVELGILETAPELEEVTSEQFPQPASRPRWSVLSTGAIQKDLGVQPASLNESLRKCLQGVQAGE